ncbi:MAG: hypothetical protein JST73_11295, partial [Actinobacteria bacterium]|nr:hypothetical protein [Actinomycetota bacterium]
ATGDTTAALTEAAPEAPFGLAVDPDRFTRAVLAQFHKSDLVVADPGETLRAESYIPFQSKASADASRTRALRVTDDLLGDLVHRVPAGTRIIVFGVTPGDSSWALTPFVIAGSGIVPGRIDSPATHRAGMSTLTDLTPTILTSLGVPSPEPLPGSAVRETPGSFSWSASRRYDRMFATHAAITKPMMLSSIILQSALFVGALVFIGLGRPGRRLSKAFELGTLIFASWPLATFLVRMSVALSSLGFATFAIVWVIAVAIGTITWKLARTPLVALFAIACATVTVIAVDLASGARLLFGSYFGYTPDTASRYFGINNSVFAILAACAVVAATIAVDRGVGRDGARTGLWAAIALLTVTIIVDGAPWMGADVGGILTLVPILGITMWALSGRKVRWTYVVAAVAAAGVALGIAIGSDLIRRPDQRSHVSRFFVGIGIGHSHEFMQTIAEKWAANTAALGQSLWTWVIPVAAVYGLYVIVVEHGMTRLLPAGSPVRIGVTSMLMVGLVGWLLNDSGIVVTALVFVYLGPLLILLALREMHRSGEAPRTPSSPMLVAP